MLGWIAIREQPGWPTFASFKPISKKKRPPKAAADFFQFLA